MSTGERSHLLSHPARKVDIAQIQKELDGLWESFEQDVRDGAAVTRACMSNLIIYCDNEAQAQEIEHSIPAVVQVHPARVIMLTGNGRTAEPGLEVSVSGHFFALSDGWQVCAEQICVLSDKDSNRRLPSVTRTLLVGDLPTTLWWASHEPPPVAGKLFFKLATMAEQIIYDSTGWTNPTRGLQAMSRWMAAERSEHVIFNLSWSRLTPWRRLLSQILDPRVQPGALTGVARVHIEHGPHALAMALLLLGWLASRLGWRPLTGKSVPGKELLWKFAVNGHQVPVTLTRLREGIPAPHRIRWFWQDGKTGRCAEVADFGDQRLGIAETCTDVPAHIMHAPEPLTSELVSAQIAHRTRHKVFEEALAVGNTMTSVLGA